MIGTLLILKRPLVILVLLLESPLIDGFHFCVLGCEIIFRYFSRTNWIEGIA